MLSDGGIIKDARVLKEYFIPKKIKHRDGQLKAIRDNPKPAIEGNRPRDSFLYGPPGTGKTCLARYLLEELGKRSGRVETSYVNCFENSSEFGVLYELVTEIESLLSVHRKGTPTGMVVKRLKRIADENQCVVVLDEVDKLRETDVLYHLARTTGIGLVLMANRETALWNGDRRIRSFLFLMESIEFSEYSLEELVDILQDRAKWGLMPDSARKEQLERIAMLAEGDARLAIDSLWIAAEKSEQEGEGEIKDDFIEDAVSEAKEEIDSKTLEKLNEDQLTLYRILKKEEELEAGELHKKYRERVDDPVVKRTVRKYLEKLERLGLIETEGERSGVFIKLRKDKSI